MTKNEEFKMEVENANHSFSEKRDLTKCLWHLRKAGDIVLKEFKKEKKEATR